jgi:hypothetical protein
MGLKRDKFPIYRLPESKLQEFLEKVFGGPYDFSISVSSPFTNKKSKGLSYCKLKNDHWVFKIPAKLTKVG